MPSVSLSRTLAVLWLLALVACSVQLASRFSSGQTFDTSILALLPKTEQTPLVDQAVSAMEARFANQVLFLVGSKHADDKALLSATTEFADRLDASGVFTDTQTRVNDQLQSQLVDLYRPYRYQLLTEAVRTDFVSGDLSQLQAQAIRQLVSPVAMPRFVPVLEDPLNLLGYWLTQLQPKAGFQADAQGLVASDDQYRYRVIAATFEGSPFELGRQQQLLAAIAEASRSLKTNEDNFVLLRSGLVFHAAAGANQARSELTTIGLGSLLAIIALLFWHFRTVRPLLLPLVSIGSGLLLALTVSLQVFGQIHVVTLAFGASLVGVSVDYALHYLCCRHHLGQAPLRHILPGISLGLASSVFAYGAQSLTPFPGLQQIAVFSAAGLIGAWLTVVFWFPLLAKPQRLAGFGTPLGQMLCSLAAYRRPIALLVGVLAVLAAIGLPRLTFHDDLQALNTSPAALLAQEQKIQQLSQRPSSNRFVLLQADDAQSLLQREEAFRQSLDRLVADKQLLNYQAYSQFIPSIERQRQDYQQVRDQLADGPVLSGIFATLGAGSDAAAQSRAVLRNHAVNWLTPANPDARIVREQFPYLWQGNTADGKVASTIALGVVTAPGVYEQIAALTTQYPGVTLVNKVEDISLLLSRYRVTVSQWIVMAYGLVILLLAWRYRQATWRVVAPPLLATLMTFGLLAFFGQVLNLFNLLATLLILGIGLDIGIFLRESRLQIHAWEAVTLAATTSMLAFGLLALSDTPVLHYFGLTILPGISLTWLIAFVAGSGGLASEGSGPTPDLPAPDLKETDTA